MNCPFLRYGELQGLNKQETADRYGKEQVHEWRRSYDIPPPNGESLEMCAQRAVAYFKDQVCMTIYLLRLVFCSSVCCIQYWRRIHSFYMLVFIDIL